VDKLTKEQRRKNMQAVKASGSKIETTLAKALYSRGHRYRKNDKSVFGKPDLTFKKIKLAIFVDSEFWHGKDWEVKKSEHKSNKKFWFKKIERNIERDKEVNIELQKQGWIILRFWGEEIIKNLVFCVNQIEKEITKAKNEISRKNIT
jgi:DNA mismatch endonuclease Vsr